MYVDNVLSLNNSKILKFSEARYYHFFDVFLASEGSSFRNYFDPIYLCQITDSFASFRRVVCLCIDNRKLVSRLHNKKGAYRGFTGGFLLLRIFSVAIYVSPPVCFTLDIILISMFLR